MKLSQYTDIFQVLVLDYPGKGDKKSVRCWGKNKDTVLCTLYFNLNPLDAVESQDSWTESKREENFTRSMRNADSE